MRNETMLGLPEFTILTYCKDDKELKIHEAGEKIKLCQGENVVEISEAQLWALNSIFECMRK